MDEYEMYLVGNLAEYSVLPGPWREWGLMALHDDDIEELHHFDKFMLALRQRFKNSLVTQINDPNKIYQAREEAYCSLPPTVLDLASQLVVWTQAIEYF